jgi:alkylation response protein AidB-like acyl-CoA dehydrogenase
MGEFADLHDELRSVARDLLGAVAGDAAADWRLLADSGWLGLEVPEELDGSGVTFAEVAVVLQEMGRAATRAPYLGSVVLATAALLGATPTPERDERLRSMASGADVVALALSADDEAGAAEDLPFRLERAGAGLLVRGQAPFVVDAPEAGRVLLPAADGDAMVLVELAAGAPGLRVDAQPVLDATRRLGTVTADGVEALPGAVHRLGGDRAVAVQALRDRAAVAVACDSLGVSEAMLAATVAYAGARHQFGRPIGSFQAVKHACADLLVQISVARELVAAAVDQVAAGAADASVAASMAKAYATAAAVTVTGTAMQLHGGIGYTWESGIHVYVKRAALNRSLFGSPVAHRRRLARRYA